MESNSMPFFSVIVPLYNKESYVERALRGVLAQRDGDFEVIVVDDGSTDDGAAIARSILDSRIRVFSQENQGVAAARNAGMSIAVGQWLAFLDADDLWGCDHLSELRRLFSAFPDAGMVGATSREVEEGGDVGFLEKTSPGLLRRIDYFDEAAHSIGVLHTSTVAINHAVFEALGGFGNYRYGQDLEYWARVALYYPVAKSNRRTAVYYRNTGGAMDSMAKTSPSQVPEQISLSSISPSVAMLSTSLNELPQQDGIYSSVMKYINSRVVQAMRSSFIRGDVLRMKALRSLCVPPLEGWRQRGWWLASALPLPLIFLVSRARQIVKFIFHKSTNQYHRPRAIRVRE